MRDRTLPSSRDRTAKRAAAQAAVELARQNEIDMPVVNMIYKIIYKNHPVNTAVEELLTRHVTSEDRL